MICGLCRSLIALTKRELDSEEMTTLSENVSENVVDRLKKMRFRILSILET